MHILFEDLDAGAPGEDVLPDVLQGSVRLLHYVGNGSCSRATAASAPKDERVVAGVQVQVHEVLKVAKVRKPVCFAHDEAVAHVGTRGSVRIRSPTPRPAAHRRILPVRFHVFVMVVLGLHVQDAANLHAVEVAPVPNGDVLAREIYPGPARMLPDWCSPPSVRFPIPAISHVRGVVAMSSADEQRRKVGHIICLLVKHGGPRRNAVHARVLQVEVVRVTSLQPGNEDEPKQEEKQRRHRRST
mmetsp:Transcript_55172/g.124236  ORF Transcript_55172/g.124236 Transcript_55172/m.124236 type:complete len:243 (+) Transcript_55172:628-1356(+)